MASTSRVGCSLKFYEANNTYPTDTDAIIIQLRIKLRYQLCVKAYGAEFLVDDISAPEFVSSFSMPLAFLMSNLCVMFISDQLSDLNVDAGVRDFSSPRIAKFAFDTAKRYGAAVSGFMTVVEVSIGKVNCIREEEFNRISSTLKPEDIDGSKDKSLLIQNLKLEDQSAS
ncbi:hypothetical protein V6N13_056244 [Hibiscus sabdariffa]|uniref:Uncharacterized protein n=1 Tax=Hibiscus sabdariffa TaxID=183260 RepID=A0ABR2BCS6_9ROSI